MTYIYIFGLVFIDIFTKILSKNYLLEQKNLISDFLFLKYIENNGVAFGIQITGLFLKIITIIVIIGIIWYYIKGIGRKVNKIEYSAYIFILSGAIGNGYERIFNDTVIDFIGIKYFSIFNFADFYITIGIILIVYTIIFKKYDKPK